MLYEFKQSTITNFTFYDSDVSDARKTPFTFYLSSQSF